MSWRTLVRSPVVAAGLLALLVGLVLIELRSLGALESLELTAYDWYLRLRPIDQGPSPRIVVIACTERDLQNQRGWPLSDAVVAGALRKLLAYGPRAVGLDIYRDVPVPPGSEELDHVLKEDAPIVAVMQFGGGGSAGVAPPPVLKNSERVGFDDVLVDPGGTVRRGLLYLDDGGTPRRSFGLQLALLYLRHEGITERGGEQP